MRLVNQVVLASMNVEKYREFKSLLLSYPEIELIPVEGLIRNPEKIGQVENHSTYLENAIAKARLVNQGCHYPALADDSGLEVNILNGRPGVRSHRYAPPKARVSQDQANVQLLLEELKGKPQAERTARFVCSLCLCMEGILVHSTGVLEGTLIESPRGENGFGYDPIFVPKGHSNTLAEMSGAEKNNISHRARALHDMIAQLKSRGMILTKP